MRDYHQMAGGNIRYAKLPDETPFHNRFYTTTVFPDPVCMPSEIFAEIFPLSKKQLRLSALTNEMLLAPENASVERPPPVRGLRAPLFVLV